MIELVWNGVAPEPETERLVRRAVTEALHLAGSSGDVTVMVTDGDEIQGLNRTFRNVDAVTDVLTVPAWEGEASACPPDGYLGDIAVCYPRAVEQAVAYGHSIEREIAFLSVHGALHLSGYDHIDPADEQKMLAKQKEILNRLGLTR